MRSLHQAALAAALVAATAVGGGAAAAPAHEPSDLREFRIGMAVSDLPQTGYLDFACAAAPDREIAGWADYAKCPADAEGRHAVSFRYDDRLNALARLNTDRAGTKVGGHPVVLSVMIGPSAHVDAIRIETDPKARLYMRKKAFLLADQVKQRYGSEGWACTEAKPTGTEEPVGGLFLKERCEKRVSGRHLTVNRELYRHQGEDLKNFVGGTQVLIERDS